PDPRLHDRIVARRRLALMTARLERDVQSRTGEVDRSACLDRVDLGVWPAEALVPAFAKHLAVAGHHGADNRVGLHVVSPLLGELDSSLEVCPVGLGGGRIAHIKDRDPHPVRSCPPRYEPPTHRSCTVSTVSVAQPVDGHLWAGPVKGERVVVKAPVEVKGRAPATRRIGRGAIGDFASSGKRAVVGNRGRGCRRVGKSAARLGGAGDDPTVALTLIPADQGWSESGLIVLQGDRMDRLWGERAVGSEYRFERRILLPALELSACARFLEPRV